MLWSYAGWYLECAFCLVEQDRFGDGSFIGYEGFRLDEIHTEWSDYSAKWFAVCHIDRAGKNRCHCIKLRPADKITLFRAKIDLNWTFYS